tara:strand:- start:751 stop:1281 length:531 start_codon:yes stop_codon:yes gene_type:complete
MILLAWMLADFITGVVHWFEDKYLHEGSRFKFIDGITKDNIKHHNYPHALCIGSLWSNINTSLAITIPLTIVLIYLGAQEVIYLAVAFASFGNIIHRYSHEHKRNVPVAIRWIQATGFMISQCQHGEHHFNETGVIGKDDTTKRYCVMTSWLNPILDYINFFGTLEIIISIVRKRI